MRFQCSLQREYVPVRCSRFRWPCIRPPGSRAWRGPAGSCRSRGSIPSCGVVPPAPSPPTPCVGSPSSGPGRPCWCGTRRSDDKQTHKYSPVYDYHSHNVNCHKAELHGNLIHNSVCTRRHRQIKEALYRIWCGANRLGDSGVHTRGDNSAFVNPAGQLLLPGGVRPEWIGSA